MFKSGKYKTIKPNVTVFRDHMSIYTIPEVGSQVEIATVEEKNLGKVIGYMKDGSYIILKNIKGDISVEAVKAAKKKGEKNA